MKSLDEHPLFQIGKKVYLIPKGAEATQDPQNKGPIYKGTIHYLTQNGRGTIKVHGRIDYMQADWNSDNYHMFDRFSLASKYLYLNKLTN